jgi:hypothetical protein
MDLDINVDIMKNYNKMKVMHERNQKLNIIKSLYKINLLKQHTLAKSSKIKEDKQTILEDKPAILEDKPEDKPAILEQSNEINVTKNKYTILKKGTIIVKK